MAAALLRGATGVCARCIHRQLCRMVWRPQAALFSSKQSDRRPPRRTHIKKAKPQPPVDVAKLLEQLFSQRRPGTAPPAGKARPTKAAASSLKVSTSNVPPLSRAEPAVPVFAAASSSRKPDSVLMAPPPPQTAPPLSAPNKQASRFTAATVETIIESTESQVEPRLSSMQTLEEVSVEGPVEHIVDATAEEAQSTGVAATSHTRHTKDEPSVETTADAPVETMETLHSTAVVEVLVEATIDIDISHTATVEPLIEVESRDAVAEGPVDATIDAPAQAVQTCRTHSGHVSLSHIAEEEPLVEPTVEASVDAPLETLESRAAVSECAVEPTIANEVAPEPAPLPLKQEVGSSGNLALEEESNKPEQMTLESVTLYEVQVQVEGLKTNELLRTTSALDEEAAQRVQEMLDHTGTGAEHHPAAETGNLSEHESETLTEVLTEWESLSEELQDLDRESGTLVTELLCHVPAVLSKGLTSGPPVGATGERLTTEEKGTVAESVTLESITLSGVTAEVGGLETDVLLETRNALEKEAEVLAQVEKMGVRTASEDVALFEDTAEAELTMLDSISEATDTIEAEMSVMLEAMLGSEQGLRRPPDALLIDQRLRQQDEMTDQEAEQEGTVLEAMTVESVTLAEVEASLGSLESLSETSEHLEKEADVLTGEKRKEVEDDAAPPEALKIESLSLLDGDALSEALQTDALMEELLFSVPGHVMGRQSGHEVVRTNISHATAEAGSVDADSAAAVTDDAPASPALEEVLLGQDVQEEEGGHTEALGAEKGLDPVQRLFLEKIREYDNMHRLNGGPLEAEPHYQKYLSEETAKLQRLYGGGDLSSFPEFTFSEPNMDQDSK